MDYEREGNIITARLDHGEPLFDSLFEILEKEDRESATVISGIGMLTDFRLGYYDDEGDEYIWEGYDEPMELLSLAGSITSLDDIHLHALVAGEDHSAVGGHLGEATVFNVNEITMLVFDEIELGRKTDEERGTEVLSVGRNRERWIHGGTGSE